MRLRLLVVGKGATSLSAYEQRFLQRMRSMASVQIVEVGESHAKQLNQRRQQEAKLLQKRIQGRVVLFDERGRDVSSVEWAQYSKRYGDKGIDWLIGGADGVAAEVHERADDCWRLSSLTLPHQLARVLAVEQIYRALTILKGHPYHRV